MPLVLNLRLSLYLLSVSLLAFTSCSDKIEPIPSFIRIDSISVSTDYATQGSSSSKITEAWVYLDEDLQGIYDLPAEIPLLAFGRHNIKITGGIRRNGISSDRQDYPFYTLYETNVDLEPGVTDTIKPVVTYFSSAKIWLENFEDAGHKFTRLSFSDTGMFVTRAPGEVFEGTGTGKIVLTPGKYNAVVASTKNFVIPSGVPLFMEMDYRTTDTVMVGMVAHNIGGDTYEEHLFINPTYDDNGKLVWNKIYINLTELRTKQTAPSYDLFFHIRNIEQTSSEFLVDNLKLIYF